MAAEVGRRKVKRIKWCLAYRTAMPGVEQSGGAWQLKGTQS